MTNKDLFKSQECAPLLRALAEPVRLRIVDVLRAGAKSVGEIAAALDLEVVNVSHHLGILRHARIVEGHRDGRYIIYRLAEGILQNDSGTRSSAEIDLGCCKLVIPKPPQR